MLTSRREVVLALAAAGLLPKAVADDRTEVLTPEAFGATGDGRTNDTAAFAALSSHVNRSGGGVVVLRPVTYIVGRQRRQSTDGNELRPSPILHFINCGAPVIIRGNGARLRAAAGLRFGSFDPHTGRAFQHKGPLYKPEFASSPYVGMIHAERCSALIDVSDIELDGNLNNLEIGGHYGNEGWQIPGSGIRLENNSGAQRFRNIHTHHHPLDGLTVTDVNERSTSSMFSNVVSDHNGRQGCSITSGRNYSFDHCIFGDTGMAGLLSAPGAGVDIEAEAPGIIRNIRFSRCEFVNNNSVGMDADSGDSADLFFEGCRFIGTTGWAAWPRKPRMRFDGCTFVGSIVNAYGDEDPTQAAQFHNCSFVDDPGLSPTRRVYLGGGRLHPIVNLPSARNVLFDHCRFHLTDEGGLPFTSDVIYSDCQMSQRSTLPSYPRGTYLGTNVIIGNPDLSGSHIHGSVRVNGRVIPRTR